MIAEQPVLQRVLILADESAGWRVAGLSQLHRILLSLNEYADAGRQTVPVNVCVWWNRDTPVGLRQIPADARLTAIEISETESPASECFDIALSTRVFLHRDGIAAIVGSEFAPCSVAQATSWTEQLQDSRRTLRLIAERLPQPAWEYLTARTAIPRAERVFLRRSGKSQDGLVSQYLNRPISRAISRQLLKISITPSTWSVMIFVLPLVACSALLQGSLAAIIVGCLVFQLYSIVDGCDGEIARATFQHSQFGRRLDSLLDLAGNMLLAICLGIGLGLHALPSLSLSWFYIAEGAAAAACVVLSEGIVFLRRSRRDQHSGTTALNGVLYHRHHEFFQRSGILVFGEAAAWWMVVLTKRDMAMLAFVVLALVGYPQWILHLLLGVGAINSVLAGNAFFRAAAPAIQQEAS